MSGVEGADLPFEVTLILGTANLFADALSMGFGDWISAQAEVDHHNRVFNDQIENFEKDLPKQKKLLTQIYQKKGF